MGFVNQLLTRGAPPCGVCPAWSGKHVLTLGTVTNMNGAVIYHDISLSDMLREFVCVMMWFALHRKSLVASMFL